MSQVRKTKAERTPSPPGALLAGVTLAIFLFWIGFTATVKSHELLLGGCTTALTLALFFNIIRTESLRFRLRLRDLLVIWRVPGAVLRDCWILIVVLFNDLTGREPAGSFYRACGFRTSTHDPVLIGRSALAIAYTTASPNMMVIGIDPAQSLMLFHQLKRDPVPRSAQALGAAGQHASSLQPVQGASR